MTFAELTGLLQEFHREKAGLLAEHLAAAAAVSSYDFNNTYQYVINREETHVSWLRTALEELGVAIADHPVGPAVTRSGRGRDVERGLIVDDQRRTRDFVERWTPRVGAMTNARHQKMLRVILGETLEQVRFFDQMLEGRDDLLGRRHANVGTGGGVLSARWRE